MLKICTNTRFYCQKIESIANTQMKYLNVAEKNDAAKNISAHLSRGTSQRVSAEIGQPPL